MKLPAELLQAVSAPGGGKITLVVGAGCSFEAPSSIPLAGTCSQQCHDRLVEDGVLANGDCPTPWNLSCLADAVVAKRGHQRLLVEQLSQHYALKATSPNEGHLLAAALLREGAIASVVTLNFDLALSIAIGQLGVGDAVGIIDGPDDFPNQKAINLYYLHRNANAADPETWILRTAALKTEWKGNWEAVVEDGLDEAAWTEWWGQMQAMGLKVSAVPMASREAAGAIDAAIKQLDAARRAAERKRPLLDTLTQELGVIASKARPDLAPLQGKVAAEQQRIQETRAKISAEQARVVEVRRLQAELKEKSDGRAGHSGP